MSVHLYNYHRALSEKDNVLKTDKQCHEAAGDTVGGLTDVRLGLVNFTSCEKCLSDRLPCLTLTRLNMSSLDV